MKKNLRQDGTDGNKLNGIKWINKAASAMRFLLKMLQLDISAVKVEKKKRR